MYLYNVVGGVITYLVLVNGAMSSTQRYITLSEREASQLQKPNEANVHLLVALLILFGVKQQDFGSFTRITVIPPLDDKRFWVYRFQSLL